MNQGHVEEELLHRYFDGDLLAPQAATVAQHLSGCADCTARHRELSELRKMIETSAEHNASEVDFDALFTKIERGIREERNAPTLIERLSVWGRDLSEQRPARLWVPVAGALAAAILLGLLMQGGPSSEGPRQRAEGEKPAKTIAEPELGSDPEEEQKTARVPKLKKDYAVAEVNSEIVQVDFGSSAGTVYEIALAEGVSTPVVWINDDVQ